MNIDTKTAVLIFKALILSRFEYRSIYCLSSHSNLTLKLQILLIKALIICLKLPYFSNVFEMHEALSLLPLNIRRNVTLMKLMYQYSRDLNGDNELVKVESKSTIRTRTSAVVTLRCRFPKSEFFKRSVAYQGPSMWLKQPNELNLAGSLEEFKVNMKSYY